MPDRPPATATAAEIDPVAIERAKRVKRVMEAPGPKACCRLSQAEVAHAIEEIHRGTALLVAAQSAPAGSDVAKQLHQAQNAARRLVAIFEGEARPEIARALDMTGAFAPGSGNACIERLTPELARFVRLADSVLKLADLHRDIHRPRHVPGLLTVTVGSSSEAYRLHALAGLYARMFGRKASATENGPFFRFVQAAFKALGIAPPTSAMVRRHLERHPPPEPPKD